MKKLIIPILVLLNLAVSCDKGSTTTETPPVPDTALFFKYSIGNTNYSLSYLGSAMGGPPIYTYDQLVLSAQNSKIAQYPSVVIMMEKPANGWKTSLLLDQNNQKNFIQLNLAQSISYNSKFVIPSDTSGIHLNFTKFNYSSGSVIEGDFFGLIAKSDDPSAYSTINNGKFRLRIN